jgi:predicted DNA-binding transcriptional regulator AlpA
MAHAAKYLAGGQRAGASRGMACHRRRIGATCSATPHAQSALAARLLMQPASTAGQGAEADTLLDVGETARRLGTTKDWLYRHADQLPFTVRMGPRQLRFSAKGVERYLRQRQGR